MVIIVFVRFRKNSQVCSKKKKMCVKHDVCMAFDQHQINT